MAAPRRSDAGTPEEIERSIAGGRAEPVYVLEGSEGVLHDRVLHALKEKLLAPGFEAFNYRSLEPSGLDAYALADEMRVLPMGGGKRLVVISPADSLLKDHLKALGAYAADPSPASCLVLVAGDVKEGMRKAFEKAAWVDCSSPWEDRIPALLDVEARRLGVTLSKEAGSLLAAICGRDLSRAVSELRKAAGRTGPGGAIGAPLVRDIAGGEAAGDIFKVASALARGDAASAVLAARRFVEAEERAELRVLYECAMHLRRLLQARALVASGTPARDAAKAVRVFWKDADAFASELSKWDEERIAAAFRRLLAADRGVKRGLDDGGGLIESYIWATLRPERGTGAARSWRA
jgi:DNA polymerase-3 subunit delta